MKIVAPKILSEIDFREKMWRIFQEFSATIKQAKLANNKTQENIKL